MRKLNRSRSPKWRLRRNKWWLKEYPELMDGEYSRWADLPAWVKETLRNVKRGGGTR